MQQASELSSVPSEFLAALTANESGGNPSASRFEPSVYRHLQAVAAGEAPVYGRIRAADLNAQAQENRSPKTEEFHTRYLTQPFGANNRQEIATSADDALRQLATSWGFTQIMGYHMVARRASVRDLLEPQFHYRVALELLSEFADAYQLNLGHEFEEMFRCWNTGRPYGKTFDPEYVENGMRRVGLYRELVRVGALRPTRPGRVCWPQSGAAARLFFGNVLRRSQRGGACGSARRPPCANNLADGGVAAGLGEGSRQTRHHHPVLGGKTKWEN